MDYMDFYGQLCMAQVNGEPWLTLPAKGWLEKLKVKYWAKGYETRNNGDYVILYLI